MKFLLEYEEAWRIGVFVVCFAVLLAAENHWPRRTRRLPRSRRWPANLGLVVVSSLAVRAALPILAVEYAVQGEQSGWGLFHTIGLPLASQFILALLAFDLLIYGQHIAFHKIPLLWRLHRVHHSDTDLDVTSGVRFHFIEIIVSMLIKLLAVRILGPPAAAVLVFEIVLYTTALFNHANLRLKPQLDRALRWLVVTPDMHRIHHSVHRAETDSNFGFNLPLWDRLFGTYRAAPRDGHTLMQIGIEDFRDNRSIDLRWLLVQPLLTPDRSR